MSPGLVDRHDSVLVVVDAQPGFVAAEPEGAATVERIAWMAGMARLLGIPAVAVEEGPEREGPTEPSVLAALPEATPVVTKPTFGVAGCPEAVAAIEATGRRTAVLVGFETDVCVMQSAVGLAGLGYRSVVLADAAYTTSARDHERGLVRLADAGIERNHCKGIVFEWLRVADEAIEVFEAARALGTPPWRI